MRPHFSAPSTPRNRAAIRSWIFRFAQTPDVSSAIALIGKSPTPGGGSEYSSSSEPSACAAPLRQTLAIFAEGISEAQIAAQYPSEQPT